MLKELKAWHEPTFIFINSAWHHVPVTNFFVRVWSLLFCFALAVARSSYLNETRGKSCQLADHQTYFNHWTKLRVLIQKGLEPGYNKSCVLVFYVSVRLIGIVEHFSCLADFVLFPSIEVGHNGTQMQRDIKQLCTNVAFASLSSEIDLLGCHNSSFESWNLFTQTCTWSQIIA